MDIGDIVGNVSSAFQGDPKKLVGALSGLIGNSGGLSKLVSGLKGGGLGDEVDSWVGKGKNKPADPDRLARALGAGKVKEVASKAGVTEDEAKGGIAAALPQLIDQLTPDGGVPTSGVGSILDGLKGMLGG